MKITVINGTEKHGVTYRLKEAFLNELRDSGEITEFFLPKDCPNLCAGCMNCVKRDEQYCKDREYIARLEQAMLDADLLVFTFPVYVYHVPGALKNMLDHFAYRWMVHRPAKAMFGKRAVIITQSLGSGTKSAVKDLKDSLSWWGVSSVKVFRFRLMGEVMWDKLPEKKRRSMTGKLEWAARVLSHVDYSVPTRTRLGVKLKFYASRIMQKTVGKTHPDSRDYQYWQENDWLGKVRPWGAR